ncbi:unnamed protein product [Dovyalis caffra]|uniref:Uncharacterized protein n=1 Tax=Dovyalis caffra TaxID=77055 RepID=A0AAV1QW99_9ROSI|nr:unnamed protein product [Dovyalis caffra]
MEAITEGMFREILVRSALIQGSVESGRADVVFKGIGEIEAKKGKFEPLEGEISNFEGKSKLGFEENVKAQMGFEGFRETQSKDNEFVKFWSDSDGETLFEQYTLDLGKPSYQVKECGPLLSQGILTSIGVIWAHQRKIPAPELYIKNIETEEGAVDISIDEDMRSFFGDSNYAKGKEIFLKLRALQGAMSKKVLSSGHPILSFETIVTATWTMILLASNPEWQDRVRVEVYEVCRAQLSDANMICKMKIAEVTQSREDITSMFSGLIAAVHPQVVVLLMRKIVGGRFCEASPSILSFGTLYGEPGRKLFPLT